MNNNAIDFYQRSSPPNTTDVFAEVCKQQVKSHLLFCLDAAVQMQIPELFCQDFSPSDLTCTHTHVSMYILPHKLNTDELRRKPHLTTIGSDNQSKKQNGK